VAATPHYTKKKSSSFVLCCFNEGRMLIEENICIKKGEVRRTLINLSEEFIYLCSSSTVMKLIISKGQRKAGSDSRMDELINACNILVGKSEAKYRLGYDLSRSFVSRVVSCE
jgi:hypothetical protein